MPSRLTGALTGDTWTAQPTDLAEPRTGGVRGNAVSGRTLFNVRDNCL